MCIFLIKDLLIMPGASAIFLIDNSNYEANSFANVNRNCNFTPVIHVIMAATHPSFESISRDFLSILIFVLPLDNLFVANSWPFFSLSSKFLTKCIRLEWQVVCQTLDLLVAVKSIVVVYLVALICELQEWEMRNQFI